MSLTHTQFINKVKTNKFRKCLNNELRHHGFQYKIGLNKDRLPFNPTGSYEPGGLYFTTTNHINDFLDYGLNIAIIELCPDAEFYIEDDGTTFKTNKFIIKQILPQTEKFCELAVQEDSGSFRHVQKQTNKISKLAVQRNSWALEFVKNQTKTICKMAVKKNGYSLRFVRNQTDKICKLAVQQKGEALQYVQEQTEELCRLAVQQNGMALQFVRKQTEELCRLAVQQNGSAVQFVKN